MLRILVVEDNPDLRETLGLLLEADGRTIEDAADAESALAAFQEAPFDVVFTDVRLPKMSGTELAGRLHALRPSTWIVYSSGATIERPSGAAAARTRVLSKPFMMDTLDALMAEIEAAPREASAS